MDAAEARREVLLDFMHYIYTLDIDVMTLKDVHRALDVNVLLIGLQLFLSDGKNTTVFSAMDLKLWNRCFFVCLIMLETVGNS